MSNDLLGTIVAVTVGCVLCGVLGFMFGANNSDG